ncbi:MAG: polysaccharide biosynthesis/export family protein [Bacteroidota bacterium]
MRIRYIFLFLLIGFVFLSCTSRKKILYFQNKLGNDSLANFIYQKPVYLLKAGDILYINIASINQEVVNVFNINSTTNASSYYSDASLFVNGYSVNDSGFVDIPVIGSVKVDGIRLSEARNLIQKQVDMYLKDATAIVKLLSFKITVLGEVGRPGVYSNYNENITVLEAIGMAGDITDYGDKTDVLVVRPSMDGNEIYRMDLTDINLLTKEGYFLLPNDIVYIEPLRLKAFRMNTPNISIILSIISTLILIIRFVQP